MVESSIFAENETNPPLVPATPMIDSDSISLSAATTVTHVEPLQMDGSSMHSSAEATEDSSRRIMVGAGVAAGVVGMLLGGPILACIAGLGTAYATKRGGATGDVARAVGHVALTAQAKAVEVNQKHQIMERTTKATKNAYEKAKELDRKHHILQRTRDFMVSSWNKLVEANQKHRLLDRTVDAVGSSLTFLALKIAGTPSPSEQEQQEPQPQLQASNTTTADSKITMPLPPPVPPPAVIENMQRVVIH